MRQHHAAGSPGAQITAEKIRSAAEGVLRAFDRTLGGISSGQDIVAHLALKPTSSIRIPGRSIDRSGAETEVVTTGRHDPCVGVRATPIAEAMLALVLMDHLLRQRAQNPGRTPPTND